MGNCCCGNNEEEDGGFSERKPLLVVSSAPELQGTEAVDLYSRRHLMPPPRSPRMSSVSYWKRRIRWANHNKFNSTNTITIKLFLARRRRRQCRSWPLSCPCHLMMMYLKWQSNKPVVLTIMWSSVKFSLSLLEERKANTLADLQ